MVSPPVLMRTSILAAVAAAVALFFAVGIRRVPPAGAPAAQPAQAEPAGR